MDGSVGDFKDLDVWRVAMHVVALTYRATRALPEDERFGLTGQMRRAAVSMASNVAEGYGRGRRQEYARFLQIARGSACELETQVLVCERLGYEVETSELLRQLKGWYQLLNALLRTLDCVSSPPSPPHRR